jgi:chromosome segregation ATPase
MIMILLRMFLFFAMFVLGSCIFLSPLSYAAENNPNEAITEDVVLTSADQLILDRIDKLGKELNGRIDKLGKELNGRIDNLGRELNGRIDNLGRELNGRIDTLWITMLGGFMGVMAFIGAIVFWDRSTFMKRARKECQQEVSGDRKKLESMLAAMRKLSEKLPELREALKSFGLL